MKPLNGTRDGNSNQNESRPGSVTSPDPTKPPIYSAVIEKQSEQSAILKNTTEDKERARHDELIDRINKSERLMIGLTAIIALTGIWGGWVIYEQLKVTEGQLAEMKSGSEDTKIIAESARESSTVAKDTLQFAKDTAALDQRAWVSVPQMVLRKEPESGVDSIVIFCSVINSGKTVAKQMVTSSGVYLHAEGIPPRPNWAALNKVSTSDLPPNPQGVTIPASLDRLNNSAVSVYRSRRSKLYVRLLITYFDVSDKPRSTEVCVLHTFGDPLHAFSFCPTDNHVN